MKPVKNVRYQDTLRRERRRVWLIRLWIGAIIGLTAIGSIVYALFFSPLFKITTINAEGLGVFESDIIAGVSGRLHEPSWKFFQVASNILFLDETELAEKIKSSNPGFSEISIEKDYWHTITVKGTERKSVGIWCFGAPELSSYDCRYFDSEGTAWGQAMRTSGYLVLTINEHRDTKEIDKKIWESIREVVASKQILIREVFIPRDSVNEFQILMDKDYYIKFSTSEPISAQLGALKIFLDQKGIGFRPQEYIDLRFDGRVYFK